MRPLMSRRKPAGNQPESTGDAASHLFRVSQSRHPLMAWENPPCDQFALRDPILSKILLAKLARIVVCF